MRRVVAFRHAREIVEAARQQAGADEQHRGHRELRDDQRRARARFGARRSAAARADGAERAGGGEVQRRKQSEQHAGERRESERDREEARVDANFLHARQHAAAHHDPEHALRFDGRELLDRHHAGRADAPRRARRRRSPAPGTRSGSDARCVRGWRRARAGPRSHVDAPCRARAADSRRSRTR